MRQQTLAGKYAGVEQFNNNNNEYWKKWPGLQVVSTVPKSAFDLIILESYLKNVKVICFRSDKPVQNRKWKKKCLKDDGAFEQIFHHNLGALTILKKAWKRSDSIRFCDPLGTTLTERILDNIRSTIGSSSGRNDYSHQSTTAARMYETVEFAYFLIFSLIIIGNISHTNIYVTQKH